MNNFHVHIIKRFKDVKIVMKKRFCHKKLIVNKLTVLNICVKTAIYFIDTYDFDYVVMYKFGL